VSLGHAPVSLSVCSILEGDMKTVFAAGDRAIVFAYERGRLVYSPILLKVRCCHTYFSAARCILNFGFRILLLPVP
jgi:hypothetical protein